MLFRLPLSRVLLCAAACDVLQAAIDTGAGGVCQANPGAFCQGPCVTQLHEYVSSCEGVESHESSAAQFNSFISDCPGKRHATALAARRRSGGLGCASSAKSCTSLSRRRRFVACAQ